jgi:RNA polymerase sigma-70 factor (ECF subfamily)
MLQLPGEWDKSMNQRTNQQWLNDLRGPQQDQALTDLRAILRRGLHFALVNRVPENKLEALVDDFAQDALLKILDNIDTFRGESRFTTWAQKIAVRVAFTELRRQRWKDISLQDLLPQYAQGDFTPAVLADPTQGPEKRVVKNSMVEITQRLIMEELTDRQRQAMLAIIGGGMPMDEVARRMNTNRNALYKLMHDARQRLKSRLASEGLTPEEVLAAFDEG